MYALIFHNTVCQISDQTFPVCQELKWVDIADESIEVGYSYDGNEFSAPGLPAPFPKEKDNAHVLLDMAIKTVLGDTGKTELRQKYDELKSKLQLTAEKVDA